ncbi:hypothetical protein Tco_0537961 [Tanacetum coccineum]
MRFQQRFDESFYEAWDRFNDLLRACPHHGFSELHQLDAFYNALDANDQDSLNSAAVVAKVSSKSSTPGISPDVAALTTEVSELKNLMKTMLIDKQKAQAPATVKAVEQSCVTCGGAHSYKNCPATDGNVYQDNIQEYVSQAAAANFNQGNSNSRPPMVSNQIRPPEIKPRYPTKSNLLEKLEDPEKFLIPYALQELDRTNALADFGASINLLPHSIYKQLGLELEAQPHDTRSISNAFIYHQWGIAEEL